MNDISEFSLLMQLSAMVGIIVILLYYIVRIVCSWRSGASPSGKPTPEQVQRNWDALMKRSAAKAKARREQVTVFLVCICVLYSLTSIAEIRLLTIRTNVALWSTSTTDGSRVFGVGKTNCKCVNCRYLCGWAISSGWRRHQAYAGDSFCDSLSPQHLLLTSLSTSDLCLAGDCNTACTRQYFSVHIRRKLEFGVHQCRLATTRLELRPTPLCHYLLD